MKNRSLFICLLPLLLLSSCKTIKTRSGEMFTLPYQEEGGLKDATCKDALTKGVLEAETSVFLIGGLETCSSCVRAKEESENFAIAMHCNIYFIDINNIQSYSTSLSNDLDPNDYFYLYYSTIYPDRPDSYFACETPNEAKDGFDVPFMLMFKYGGVAKKVTTDFGDNLRLYVDVETTSS